MATSRVVLVEFFCTDRVTLVFGARADWAKPEFVEIPRSLDEIRQFVQHLRVQTAPAGMAAPMYEDVHAIDSDDWQTFAAPFIDPIRAWAAKGDLLWLVPHDVLHRLPFHPLKLDGEPLVTRHPVVYTPSASVMKYCQAKRTGRPRRRAVVLGDAQSDLPFAREEARMVAERFGTRPVLDHEATKSWLKAQIAPEHPPLDVLHFACHGYFDIEHPLRSGIALAENGDPDPNLTVEELFGLEMNADLVVLSACESGVNDRRPGDELIGLTRALIYAGTPSVLVSLWTVDDLSTLMLIERFYDGLSRKLNKAEALQQAQCHLMTFEEAEVHAYIENRAGQLYRSGQADRAQQLEQMAYEALLEAQVYNPRPTNDGTWCPFSSPASWAPFILVGDWN